MNTILPQPLSRRLDSHFLTCSAVVAGVTTFSAGQADATIIYSGLVNTPIAAAAVNGGVYFDFQTPAFVSTGATFAGWDVNPYASGTKLYISGSTNVVMSGSNAAALVGGTAIGPASIYSAAAPPAVVANVSIPSGTSAYFGFRFTPNVVGGTTPLYGWARMTVTTGAPGVLVDYAYENSGAPISAGAVPEPSSLGLLALGSLGLTQLRRRRAA